MAHKAVHDILPLSLETLKAPTWDFVCFECADAPYRDCYKVASSAAAVHGQSVLHVVAHAGYDLSRSYVAVAAASDAARLAAHDCSPGGA